jgi:BirA family transcriptional regulator, biotin operon repressor / biotin---[acetyl-CoA-carboxylase] ligase
MPGSVTGLRNTRRFLEALIVDDALSIGRIWQQLETRTVGPHMSLHHPEVASTNAALRRLAEAGASEGTVVLAEHQTTGQDREGGLRPSPPGVNVYASVLFQPAIQSAAVPVFAFIASLALANAVRELGVQAAVKWPNDVLVKGRRVASVRTETWCGQREPVDAVILGADVNLNVIHEALQAGLVEAGQFATSLREVLGRPIGRNAFTASFLTHLEKWLIEYRTEGAPAVLAAWRDRDVLAGRWVEVRDGRASFEGRALGVDAAGHLQVKDARGRARTFMVGEIRLVE